MTEKENKKDFLSLLKKINALRTESVSLDWTKEGYSKFGNYNYLPTDKIKANFAPVLYKHGLEMVLRYYDLQFLPAIGSMSQHVVLTLDVTLIDIDTGESITDTVYGEAGDSGDKAVGKAQTYAIKGWASQKFLIADGTDPDSGTEGGSTFKPKNPQEREEVRSKVLEQGVPVPTAPTVPAPKPAAPAPAPAAAPAPTPAVPVPAVPAPAAPAPKISVEPLVGQPQAFKFSAANQQAIAKVVAAWDAALGSGAVTQEQYAEMQAAKDAISSPASVMAFVNTYMRH